MMASICIVSVLALTSLKTVTRSIYNAKVTFINAIISPYTMMVRQRGGVLFTSYTWDLNNNCTPIWLFICSRVLEMIQMTKKIPTSPAWLQAYPNVTKCRSQFSHALRVQDSMIKYEINAPLYSGVLDLKK